MIRIALLLGRIRVHAPHFSFLETSISILLLMRIDFVSLFRMLPPMFLLSLQSLCMGAFLLLLLPLQLVRPDFSILSHTRFFLLFCIHRLTRAHQAIPLTVFRLGFAPTLALFSRVQFFQTATRTILPTLPNNTAPHLLESLFALFSTYSFLVLLPTFGIFLALRSFFLCAQRMKQIFLYRFLCLRIHLQ